MDPLAHILRNTAKKNITAFELDIHPSITNFPEHMGSLSKVASF